MPRETWILTTGSHIAADVVGLAWTLDTGRRDRRLYGTCAVPLPVGGRVPALATLAAVAAGLQGMLEHATYVDGPRRLLVWISDVRVCNWLTGQSRPETRAEREAVGQCLAILRTTCPGAWLVAPSPRVMQGAAVRLAERAAKRTQREALVSAA